MATPLGLGCHHPPIIHRPAHITTATSPPIIAARRKAKKTHDALISSHHTVTQALRQRQLSE
uniref:Uncharacterized protein n=1 Tax=Oryza punctata TaxID=4537 RepID=A0A0E0KTD3_ORYPU